MKAIAIDTSALVAIILGEAEAQAFTNRLLECDALSVSAAGLLEARMVLCGRNVDFLSDLDQLIFEMAIQVEPVTRRQSDIAFDAFRHFGKGSGHRAGLNFGDCFAYALAKERDIPLLFKGEDFVHTDIRTA